MLPKKKRVTKEVFSSIMKDGKTTYSPLFSLRFLVNKDSGFACVVPKAVFKKAHDRNSLRRKGYNALREMPLPPILGIFFFKKEAKDVTASQIRQQIELVFQKIKQTK